MSPLNMIRFWEDLIKTFCYTAVWARFCITNLVTTLSYIPPSVEAKWAYNEAALLPGLSTGLRAAPPPSIEMEAQHLTLGTENQLFTFTLCSSKKKQHIKPFTCLHACVLLFTHMCTMLKHQRWYLTDQTFIALSQTHTFVCDRLFSASSWSFIYETSSLLLSVGGSQCSKIISS